MREQMEALLLDEAEGPTRGMDAHDRQLFIGGARWAMDQVACNHENTLIINGKCSDMCGVRIEGEWYEGYAPTGIGLADGSDYINVTFCLDCGKVQGVPDKATVIAEVKEQMSTE